MTVLWLVGAERANRAISVTKHYTLKIHLAKVVQRRPLHSLRYVRNFLLGVHKCSLASIAFHNVVVDDFAYILIF
jgi:hypothetical protein